MRSKDFNLLAVILCILVLFFSIIGLIIDNGKQTHSLDNTCSKDAVLQLAKIIYKEVGADCAKNSEENFFMRISTGSIVLNNAVKKNGATWYNRIYNLNDNNYQGYSTYKDKSFEDVLDANQGQILYISQLIFAGKYNLPSNMNLQASKSIVERFGTVNFAQNIVCEFNMVFNMLIFILS